MRLPQPNEFEDPIQLLRACHVVLLEALQKLEHLAQDAQANGLYSSFVKNGAWAELMQFFTVAAPQHERDEEESLFPVLMSKLPSMGFQPKESPVHFLMQGHELMKQRVMAMIQVWRDFLAKAASATEELDPKSQQDFLANAKELISLYRDHMQFEEEKIYAYANNLLSPMERIEILERIRQHHRREVWTEPQQYDTPTFTTGIPIYDTVDAVAEQYFEEPNDEEGEEDVPAEE